MVRLTDNDAALHEQAQEEIYRTRLLNVARALREAPRSHRDNFSMREYVHPCGTPSCALGFYAKRSDLQQEFRFVRACHGRAALRSVSHGDWFVVGIVEHFGLSLYEAEDLFGCQGCDNAQTPEEAIAYIEAFVERKWPRG